MELDDFLCSVEDIGIWIWDHPSSKSLHARIFFQHKDLETKTIFRYVHLFKHSLVPQEIFKWRKFLQIFWPYYGPKKSTCMLHKVYSPLAYYNFVKYDIKSMKFTKIQFRSKVVFTESNISDSKTSLWQQLEIAFLTIF